MEREWLTPEEYALARKLHVKTVYRMIKRGEIPAHRYGKRALRIIVAQQAKRPAR